MTPTLRDHLVALRSHRSVLEKNIEPALKRAEEKGGKHASCHECQNADCCYQVAMSSLSDGLLIAQHLQRHGRNTKPFRKKLRKAAAGQRSASRDDWFATKTPCVFLENDRCTIYEVRPITCRAYFVVTPKELCSITAPKVTVGIFGLLHEALDYDLRITNQLSKSLGLDDPAPIGVLPEMVLAALGALKTRDPVKFLNEALPKSDTALPDIAKLGGR